MRPELTAARLRELLSYDSTTGVFTRLVTRGRFKAGDVAGTPNKRQEKFYSRICVDGKDYYAHRLAWLWMTGSWPAQEVDHRDGDGLNNRWSNLREADRWVNNQNARKPHKDGSSGFLGVSFLKKNGLWRASITIDRRPHYLGQFATKEEAHSRYIEAKREAHAGCTL